MCSYVAFRIGFERSTYTVQESDELLSVCVTADRGDGSETYLVNVTSIDLTAQGKLNSHQFLKTTLELWGVYR